MIGGGQIADFLPGAVRFSEELFVRYAQVASLMPMMQFSASPWRVLSYENKKIVHSAAKLHEALGEKIWSLAEHAAKTGEPIVRYMEYEFPNCGMEHITDQFMLGSEILAAPVVTPDTYKRKVIFPSGVWISPDNKEYDGPCEAVVDAPLDTVLYFTLKK